MASAAWEQARQERRERRKGLQPQPRSPLGFIIKRTDGEQTLHFCCYNCLNAALVERGFEHQRDADKIRRDSSRRQQRAKKAQA